MINKLSSLRQNEIFMKYFRNSSWMLTEYALKIISAIFVSIYVARYLGPEKFGLLSYALAIVAIFMAVSRLGMDSILVRDISKHPEQIKAYMGTAFGLMFGTAILAMFVLTVLISLFESDAENKLYIWIISTGLIFQTFLAIDYGFQAQVKAKFSSIAKSMALGLSSIIKIYLVVTKADLQLFAVAYAFDHMIIAIILLATHVIKKQPVFLFAFDRDLVKPMLKSAWPMVLTAAMGILLLKFDQVFIGVMLGNKELGMYTAALRLYEGWIMIPQVIAMSLIPAIVKIKKNSEESYTNKMIQFMRVVFFINLMIAIFTTIFSKQIILLLYGEGFYLSADILKIVIWCALIMGIGSVSFRYLINEGMERKIVRIMLVAMLSNMILNLVLIPVFGVHGAAIALLISLSISYVFYDFFDKDMCKLKEIKLRAIYAR